MEQSGLALYGEVRDRIGSGVVALRFLEKLEPVAGRGEPFQPPTYMPDVQDPTDRYAHYERGLVDERGEPRFEGGRRLTVTDVVVDSEGSQANRFEAGLSQLIDAGVLDFPVLHVTVNGPDESSVVTALPGQRRFTNLSTPHRHQDPLFRFGLVGRAEYLLLDPDGDLSGLVSPVDGADLVPFAQTRLGRSIIATSSADLSPLLRYAPLSLLLGMWHSFANGINAERPRVARRYAARITARDAQPVRSGATKTALFNESKDEVITSSAADPLLFDLAGKTQKADQKGKASNLGAGAAPVAVHHHGYTAEIIEWTATISVRPLLQTPLGVGVTGEQRRAVATALTLLAVLGRVRTDLFLRSGADLRPLPGSRRIEWVAADGSLSDADVAADTSVLIDAFDAARLALQELGGPVIGTGADSVALHLSPGYQRLIETSNRPKQIFKEA